MKRFALGLYAMGCAATAFAADDDAAMGRRVQELLHAHQADVYGCVAQSVPPAKGEMLVRVAVGEDQHAAKADILKDEGKQTALGVCLTGKMKKWDLTPLQAAAGDQVVFPLVFQPEPLAAGKKRILVPMSAQEAQGGQRFLIDDQAIGEAPLATLQMFEVPGNGTVGAGKPRDKEEEVLYVVEGAPKAGTEVLKPGDVLWLGADVARPALSSSDKKPFKVLDVRAHGEGTGQQLVRGALAKSYDVGDKGHVKLLLDGTPAHVAIDFLTADAGAAIPIHKHASQDEELFFVAGRSSTTVGKETFETAPGDALRVPAGAVHAVKVADSLQAIQIYAPNGPEQRFKTGSAGGDEPKPAAGKAKGKKK
jgi:quercetin dioxygenase-like cupin family protein